MLGNGYCYLPSVRYLLYPSLLIDSFSPGTSVLFKSEAASFYERTGWLEGEERERKI